MQTSFDHDYYFAPAISSSQRSSESWKDIDLYEFIENNYISQAYEENALNNFPEKYEEVVQNDEKLQIDSFNVSEHEEWVEFDDFEQMNLSEIEFNKKINSDFESIHHTILKTNSENGGSKDDALRFELNKCEFINNDDSFQRNSNFEDVNNSADIGIQKIIATIKIIIATTPKNYCDYEKKLLRPSKKLLRPSKKLLRLRKKIIATMQKNYCDLPRKCCDLPKNYCDLPKNYCDHPKFLHQ